MVKRIEWVDSIKGLAIFTVVVGHCVTDCLSSDSYPESYLFLESLKDFIYIFHMPLFFIISGFVFYISKSYDKYKVKVLDFALVYVIWSLLTWLSKYLLGSSVNNPVTIMDLVSIIYKPLMVYWYLYVLIFMYIYTSVMNITEVKFSHVVLFGIIAVVTKLFNFNIGIGNAFLYHLVFFMIGGYCVYSRLIYKINKWQILTMILIIVLNCIFYFEYQLQQGVVEIVKTFMVATVASLLCFCMFKCIGNVKYLTLLGKNTLQIYVMHCFFTGGLRIVFKQLEIHNLALYMFMGTVLGIMIPILVARICTRYALLNIVFSPLTSLEKLGIWKR